MTAPDLLQAVGVTLESRPDLFMSKAMDRDGSKYFIPSTLPFADKSTATYTGPALDSPELDAILWVEGQRWLVANIIQSESWRITDKLMDQNHDPINDTYYREIPWLLLACKSPGHALARAIAEVRG